MNAESQLKQLIKERAIRWGCDLVGFANVERFDRYRKRENRPPDGANTVIVLAIWMEDPILDLWLNLPSWRLRGRPSRAFEDEILRSMSWRLAFQLERKGYWADPAPYEPGLFLKDAGVLAGLGVIGKNNLLITREYGPRIRLRAVSTSAELEPDPILEHDFCRGCDLCLKACPSNAFRTGKYDRATCLDYCHTHLRQVSKHSVLWCMTCSEVCPVGKRRA